MPTAGGYGEPAPLRRVARVVDVSGEPPLALASRVASRFDIPTPIETFDFPEKGNINQYTFVVLAGRPDAQQEFLLQKINRSVFTRPRAVMQAMMACIQAQREGLRRRPSQSSDPEWVAITLLPTHAGSYFLEADEPSGLECWRLMVRIPDAVTYKSLSELPEIGNRLRTAEEAGRGLAIYLDLTAAMDVSGLENPLPGYRDTRLYYNQLLSVLGGNRTADEAVGLIPEDAVLRHSTGEHFLLHVTEDEYRRRLSQAEELVRLAQAEECYAMTLLDDMSTGRIRRMAIHGDTKLDNFLFDRATGRAKALVDLDTIMPHTWLADWGDMVRSLSNVAGEKERNVDRVKVDLDIYGAVARGFLGSVSSAKSEEIDRMVDAVQIIALELGVRFLADYIRGDSYFRLGPADPLDLNRVRAATQLTLFKRLRECERETRACIKELRRDRKV